MAELDDYERELAGELLAGVSRSFFTSLKVLPAATRGTIALMYLLARAADTIADTETVARERRLELLDEFARLVGGAGDHSGFVRALREGFCPQQRHAMERELLERAGRCLDWLRALSAPRRECIRGVLRTILRGQRLDLERFGGGAPCALATAAELDEYTFLVAGSVGEFWTEVGFMELGDRFAVRERGEMLALGRRYGQALQLINILRDQPADLAAGRCYLPLEEIGSTGAGDAVMLEVTRRWLARCREHFGCGAEYVGAVRNRRMRLAAALPLLIGARQLPLMERASWDELQAGIKVARSEVRKVFVRALVANLSRRGMGRHCWRALDSGLVGARV